MLSLYLYKKSSIPVISSIPAHWKEIRGKTFLHERKDKSEEGNEDLLSVSQYTGITKRKKKDDSYNYSRASSLVGYKLVDQNNLVINIMLAWNGSLGVSKYKGIVSPAYGVYSINEKVSPRFLHHLVRSEEYKILFKMYSTGVIDSRLRLYSDKLYSLKFVLPPKKEQEQIAKFLDHKNHLINNYIQIKKKQIELLKELKQAIINDAVTGKTDVTTGKPYPKYKESGIEWLGMTPKGWKLHTIGKLVSFNPSKKEIADEVRDDLLCVFIPMENLSVEGNIDCSEKRPYHAVKNGFTYFKRNDVVIAKITPCFENGKSAWLNELTTDFGFGTTEFIVMRASEQIHGKYLRYLVSSKSFLTTGKQFMRGAAGQKRIPDSFIKDYPIALPTMHTQQRINEYIDAKSKDILDLINNNLMEIIHIKELQARLNSDVVTGKLDVRGLNITKESKPSNIPFRRTVLSAEIIEQLHKEPTLGHVKFQKILYLIERLCELDIGTNYHRAAAGPHDSKAIRSIDKQLSKQCWYEAKERDGRFKYVPLAKAGQHKKYFARYFGGIEKELNRIISTLRTLNTKQCEMIATLFSAWEDLLSNNNHVTDDNIIFEVTENWTDSKKRIPLKRWNKCLAWMKENHMTPLDIGRFNAD